MSNLTFVEKSKFEQLLGMNTGYRSFAEFVQDSTGRNVYDSRYDYASGSKANRLRAFWQKDNGRHRRRISQCFSEAALSQLSGLDFVLTRKASSLHAATCSRPFGPSSRTQFQAPRKGSWLPMRCFTVVSTARNYTCFRSGFITR